MLMSFLMETAIHDDREARRRRNFFWIQARRRRIFFCDSCTWSDDFYKGNFILKLMNPKKFPPAAGSHSKIVYLKASPGGITSKNDNQWKNKVVEWPQVEAEDCSTSMRRKVFQCPQQGVDH